MEKLDGTPTRFVDLDYRDGLLSRRTTTDGEGTPLTLEAYDRIDGRLTGRTLEDGTGTPRELAYYDNNYAGHRTARSVHDGEDDFISRTLWSWRDDVLNNRTDLAANGSSVIGTASYQHDASGRLTDEHRTGADSSDLSYERDADGRLDRIVITGTAYD